MLKLPSKIVSSPITYDVILQNISHFIAESQDAGIMDSVDSVEI